MVETHGNGVKIGCHVTKKKSESVSKTCPSGFVKSMFGFGDVAALTTSVGSTFDRLMGILVT